MGYDVYGLKPKINVPKPDEIKDWQDMDWNNMTEKARERYFEAQDEYETKNPGVYFRANVWYWRPIWDYVINVCDDFLTEDDISAGFSNSGDRISKTKAIKIAKRINETISNGFIDEWEEERLKPYKKAIEHNKEVDAMMDAYRKIMKKKYGKDIAPRDYEPEDFQEWQSIQDKTDWNAHYPPSKSAVLDFRDFCKESGGFEIC